MYAVIKWKHFRATGPMCGISPFTGEFPTHRPVARCFDVFFDLHMNKRLSKQSRRRWFETLSRVTVMWQFLQRGSWKDSENMFNEHCSFERKVFCVLNIWNKDIFCNYFFGLQNNDIWIKFHPWQFQIQWLLMIVYVWYHQLTCRYGMDTLSAMLLTICVSQSVTRKSSNVNNLPTKWPWHYTVRFRTSALV